MRFETRFRPGDDVRALWLLVIAVLIAGLWNVHNRYETVVASSYGESDLLYRETVADNRIIAQAKVLSRIQRRALADLAHVTHDTTPSMNTANLLAMLHSSAIRFGTRITAVQPEQAAVDASGAGLPELKAAPLTIRLQGSFRGILRFVEDLSHHSTLISVSDTEMSLAHGEGTDESKPRLDATVHATLFRLQLTDHGEERVAAAQ